MENNSRISKNLISGGLSQVITIVLGIILPRLTLKSYGSEVNGLLNSITQIYAYVALLEAGVGIATTQALYRTLGGKNKDETNRILSATNKYYQKTGFLYLGSVIVFSAVYPLVVESDIPRITVILVIVFNGIGSVVSFFFQGKYILLLQADGRTYIITYVNLVINILRNLLKILLMHNGFDVVVVQAAAMIVGFLQMIYICRYIKTRYSWIDLSVSPDYDSISQSKNAFVHEIGSLIFNNTDVLILTFFCGLKVVSVYSLYTLVLGMVSTAITTFSNSFNFALGQLYNRSKEKYIKALDCYETYYIMLVFSSFSIAHFFLLPFIQLYTSGINDITYIDKYLPFLFISTYLLKSARTPVSQSITFAGHFKQTQWRSILESAINLIVSIGGVIFFGIYGVLAGTIVALLYRANDMIIYANKVVLKRSAWVTYRHWMECLLLYVIVYCVSAKINISFDSYFKLILFAIPYSVAVILTFMVSISLLERASWKTLMTYIMKRQLERKIRL